jgi:hypothetical protein
MLKTAGRHHRARTGGQANFFKVCKTQIHKFLGYCKSASLGVPVRKSQIRKFFGLIRKSQIRKFLQNTAQLCPKEFYCKSCNIFMYKLALEHYVLYLYGEKIGICGLAEVLSPQITKKIGSANCFWMLTIWTHKEQKGCQKQLDPNKRRTLTTA